MQGTPNESPMARGAFFCMKGCRLHRAMMVYSRDLVLSAYSKIMPRLKRVLLFRASGFGGSFLGQLFDDPVL